jgi:F-type H+-transporting ATPase subunit delta
MNDSKISVRYSRALFESALEKKILDKVYNDMIYISEIFALPEMQEFLFSPIIVPSKKIDILHRILEKNIQKLTLSFIDLVVRKERESYLPAMARAFKQETKKYKGITESVLTTAVKVDAGIRKKVSALIEEIFKTKVELTEVVDKNLIGGFVLRIEYDLIDASIKNKLRKIEKELKESSLTV